MDDVGKPPVRFPDEMRRILEAERSGLAEDLEQRIRALARPCVAVTSVRVANAPLRRTGLAKLFGARVAPPQLGVMASKFGGTPYCEHDEDWSDRAFLGQIDLAEATAVLPESAPRLHGLLRLDLPRTAALRVQWFPAPSEARAVMAMPVPPSAGTWETELVFARSWTLPEGDELEALWPRGDLDRDRFDAFSLPGYNTDDSDAHHRLLGHRSSGLDEHYGFEPATGGSVDIHDYECLLRLTFDNDAGFHWGSNAVYLIVPRADLAAGDLARIVVTGANA